MSMGIPDKHDPREAGFRHFVKLDGNGNVLAIVEVLDQPEANAQGQMVPIEPVDTPAAVHVDVTDLAPYDFGGVRATKANVTSRDKAAIKADLRTKNKVVRG